MTNDNNNARTSRKYSKLPDGQFGDFTGSVITGLTGNVDLPKPPVTPADLQMLRATFEGAVEKALAGGKMNTAAKKAARGSLATALNKNASYVDIECNGDVVILLSSGYQPVNTNRAQSVLGAPVIIAVISVQTGQLKVRIKADKTAKSFMGRIKPINGADYGPMIPFKNSRSILFTGLTAGVTYVFQLCAVGGSTGLSDWSEPQTKMAT